MLQKVVAHLSAYASPGTTRWAAPMAESYMVGQILLDRVEVMSRDSGQERLFDDHPVPAQVRSAALFATFGGYEEHPWIAQILHERIVEISQDPSKETVILLAHGDKAEGGNTKWLQVMQANIERLKQEPHCAKLNVIRAATAREDWPELRDKAVGEIRALIQEDAKYGRVLVIADRLYGAGPYKKLLSGLDYVLNERGWRIRPSPSGLKKEFE